MRAGTSDCHHACTVSLDVETYSSVRVQVSLSDHRLDDRGGNLGSGQVHDIDACAHTQELVVGGAAQLSGTLDVRLINGFIPQVGQRLMVLTAGSLTGAFTATIGTPPAGTVWVPRYSTTNVTIGLAEPLKVAGASGGPGEFALSIGTTAGFNYVVEASETLSPPDWRTVSTVTGDGLTKNLKYASDRPRSFYRVQIQ